MAVKTTEIYHIFNQKGVLFMKMRKGISAAPAADTCAKSASGGVFDDSITGYLDSCISIITAANTSRTYAAGGVDRGVSFDSYVC